MRAPLAFVLLSAGCFCTIALGGTPTAYQFVDLTPAGYGDGTAVGADGNSQVGLGGPTAGDYHALLWNGSAAGAIDLHPSSGFGQSSATAVSQNVQVGFGVLSVNPNI